MDCARSLLHAALYTFGITFTDQFRIVFQVGFGLSILDCLMPDIFHMFLTRPGINDFAQYVMNFFFMCLRWL